MKKIITLIAITIMWQTASTQSTFAKLWDYRYGGQGEESFFSMLEAPDQDLLLIGFTNSQPGYDVSDTSRGGNDYWIVKLNGYGIKEWDRRYGGSGHESARRAVAASGGGYLIAGYSGSGMTGDKSQPGRGGIDYWVVRIDEQGNKLWDRRYGSPGSDNLWALAATKDGGYILGGVSDGNAGGDKTENNRGAYEDFWVVKIDSMGNLQWDKTIGASSTDYMTCVLATQDGGYLLGGESWAYLDGDKTDTVYGGYDCWVVKLDSSGQKLWDRTFGTADWESVRNMKEYDNGNVAVIGDRYQMQVLTPTGELFKELKITAYSSLDGFELKSDGGFLFSGRTSAGITDTKSEVNLGQEQTWVFRCDSMGNKLWDKTIFTTKSNFGYAIETSDGCYVVGTQTMSGIGGYKTQPNYDTTEKSYDFWVMKFCMWPVGLSPSPQTPERGLIQVYPNPFVEDVFITLRGEQHIKEATFMLTDVQGRVLYKQHESQLAKGYTKVLDLSILPKGVYIVTVSTATGVSTQQIVKE